MTGPAQSICIGVISGAHGVRGLVKVQSFTEPAEAFADYKTLIDEAGKSVGLKIVGTAKGQFLAKIDGIEDRDAADLARGRKLFVARDQLPVTSGEEYYHADLIGMAVHSPEGTVIGHVAAVQNFGAGDILDIKGAGRPSFMVPFTNDFVPRVDVAARAVTIAAFEETE